MARAGRQSAADAESPATQSNQPPPIPPARKRPWLLAVAVLLLLAWFVFMVVNAVQN